MTLGRKFFHNTIVAPTGGAEIQWLVQAGGGGGATSASSGAAGAGAGAGGLDHL